ncbi:4-phosphopantetheinyl transferase family protein [Flavobacterium jejuense]|uniref:4-phosphopantetheinyl transferase family protein n=1 Tax=Flavobacterium jejuense TaxID=1544455 RepID=A0ABX0ISH1_9FLAO|nr:4'-phosphopantetheinyl transferase superfamily protein [Flavobacterium jejuense]NHN25797.1 4-phosphopantetheinyl transferase family protein [Flavobacterium jejuense]
MIGNDVVDLAIAKIESNWKRKGFLSKLFTAYEQDLIQKTSNQEEMVWVLWSLKESTYKAYQRIKYNRGFYPKKIEIQSLQIIDEKYFATISLFNETFHGQTLIDNKMIHSLVLVSNLEFKKITNYTTNSILKDKNSLPYCSISNNPLSISHHGTFKKIVQLHLN